MSNSIGDLIKKVITANDTHDKESVEGPDKKCDPSYQGESTPVTLPTDDETGATPGAKQEQDQQRQRTADDNKNAIHLNDDIKHTTEGYQ